MTNIKDPYNLELETGTMETSGIQKRVLGAPTMEDNIKALIQQNPRESRMPLTYSIRKTSQKLPRELKDLQIDNSETNNQRQYKGFRNICPMAEIGCVLANLDERRFWDLCSTKDYEHCSCLNEIIAGGAMENPLTFLFGESE